MDKQKDLVSTDDQEAKKLEFISNYNVMSATFLESYGLTSIMQEYSDEFTIFGLIVGCVSSCFLIPYSKYMQVRYDYINLLNDLIDKSKTVDVMEVLLRNKLDEISKKVGFKTVLKVLIDGVLAASSMFGINYSDDLLKDIILVVLGTFFINHGLANFCEVIDLEVYQRHIKKEIGNILSRKLPNSNGTKNK